MRDTHKESRQPFEILIVGFCIFSGAMYVTQQAAPGAIEKSLAPGLVMAWYWTLLIGGIVCLAGILIKDAATGLYLEVAGMLGLGFSNLAYSGAIFLTVEDPRATYAGPIMLAVSIACFIRALRIILVIWKTNRKYDSAVMHQVSVQLSEAAEKEVRAIVKRDKETDEESE